MSRRIVTSLTLSIAALVIVATSACSANAPQATEPEASATTTAAAPTSAIPTSTPQDTTSATQAALEYLQRETRVTYFEQNVPKAGELIARALDEGRFGQAKRYDDYKLDLQPGYTGWGGISSQDNTQFAWVFWLPDGSIDYTRPITQIGINHADEPNSSELLIFAPTSDDPTDTIGSYWHAYLEKFGHTVIIDVYRIAYPELSNTDPYRYPRTLDELIAVDSQVQPRLDDNMTSWFGTDWDA